MTISELLDGYNKHMQRMCAEYCYWKNAVTHDWCRKCPLWEHREQLEALREQMEDDGK